MQTDNLPANSLRKLTGSGLPPDILGQKLVLLVDIPQTLENEVSIPTQLHALQEVDSTQNQSSWIGQVLVGNITPTVSAGLIEEQKFVSHTRSRTHSSPSHQSRPNTTHNTPVQVGHHHDVELLRVAHHLHRTVVNDHFVVFEAWVFFGHFSRGLEEYSVNQLHDVRLVHRRHLLPAGQFGMFKGIVGYSQGVFFGDYFDRLKNVGNDFVFHARKLSFDVFSDDNDVEVMVSALDVGQVVNMGHSGKQVEVLVELQMLQ